MDEPLGEGRDWLRIARADLRSARLLLSAAPPEAGVAVFHCQQAAEKALKAFLATRGIAFPRAHVLPPLLELCLVADSSLESLREAAEALTPYGTAFRYPGEAYDPDPAEGAEALRFAEETVAAVAKALEGGAG